jgi:two-component system sensor histidine kinase MprB
MATTDNTLNMLGLVSFLVGLAGIGVAGTAGLWIGRTALRPVQRLTVATEYIARTGDLRQIEVTGSDELARLTNSFNTMLFALARSQDYQKRLVADAGHELRTPLTSIRTNLDLLAQATAEPDNPRLSAQDRVDLMFDVRAQMEELSVLIADLVELSRDEHPAHAIEEVDFAEIVERAVQRVQRRAPSVVYAVDLEPWILNGEPGALERMVTNLLDNAAKWSPPGGTVSARLRDGALQVADQGPGIAEEDLSHVFERFYRSPEARTMPGSGLGLAIVRQVAENHGGHVAAARAPGGGALLGVWLPGAAAAFPEPGRSAADDVVGTAPPAAELPHRAGWADPPEHP